MDPLTSQVDVFPDGLLVVTFSGTVGIGSAGNEHGTQMADVLRRAVAEHRPDRLLIDLRSLGYQWGDWIGSPLLLARKQLGTGRVCVVAAVDTFKALSSLWALGLNRLVPLMSDIGEAMAFLGPSQRGPATV